MSIKVFYNKSCKICNAEINHYKKYSNNEIEWIDIINNPKAQKLTSKTYEDSAVPYADNPIAFPESYHFSPICIAAIE